MQRSRLRNAIVSVARVCMVIGVGLLAAGCDEHTVTIRFDPEIGDEYRFRSDVGRLITTTLDGDVDVLDETSTLTATHRVTDLSGDDITVSVTVVRDGTAPRTFETKVDRASRLAAIELIEGVPASALGIALATDLPSDVSSPPTGPLEPGTRWTIARPLPQDGVEEPVVVTGQGRIATLGVEDEADVAVAVVRLQIPVRSIVDTEDGRVTLVGTQFTSSETAYDLDDGALRRDHTTVVGALAVTVEPPGGLEVSPVRGTIDYVVTTTTRRDA